MLWLLRLFPAFVRLEQRHEWLESENTRLLEALSESRRELSDHLRKMVDSYARLVTGSNVFATASSQAPEPIRHGRMVPPKPMGRDRVAQLEAEFAKAQNNIIADVPRSQSGADELAELMAEAQGEAI